MPPADIKKKALENQTLLGEFKGFFRYFTRGNHFAFLFFN